MCVTVQGHNNMGDMLPVLTDDSPSDGDGEMVGQSTFYGGLRRRAVKLSYSDTEKLIKTLEATADLLHHRLAEIQDSPESCTVKRPRRCPRIRACVRRTVYFFTGAKGITFTLLLQLITLVMLTVVDTLPRTKDVKQFAVKMGSIVMILLQIVNLIIVIFISVQLAKQLKKRRVSAILLIQSYIATILLFSGLYTATYRMNPKSWRFIAEEQPTHSPVLIVIIYCRMLFFSVSTGTLCGAADAMPKEWYNSLFASTQMLLSFMYFTSVLGLVLQPLVDSLNAPQKSGGRKLMVKELDNVSVQSRHARTTSNRAET